VIQIYKALYQHNSWSNLSLLRVLDVPVPERWLLRLGERSRFFVKFSTFNVNAAICFSRFSNGESVLVYGKFLVRLLSVLAIQSKLSLPNPATSVILSAIHARFTSESSLAIRIIFTCVDKINVEATEFWVTRPTLSPMLTPSFRKADAKVADRLIRCHLIFF